MLNTLKSITVAQPTCVVALSLACNRTAVYHYLDTLPIGMDGLCRCGVEVRHGRGHQGGTVVGNISGLWV